MTVRHLDSLFLPTSVAVIGASDREGSLGAVVLRNIKRGGFKGPVWPVNAKHALVDGGKAWPDVDSLPEAPVLAVICTPAESIPDLITALGRKGTRAAIVLSAGLKAVTPQGISIEQAMLNAARPHLLRILGPNCIGAPCPRCRAQCKLCAGQCSAGATGLHHPVRRSSHCNAGLGQ